MPSIVPDIVGANELLSNYEHWDDGNAAIGQTRTFPNCFSVSDCIEHVRVWETEYCALNATDYLLTRYSQELFPYMQMSGAPDNHEMGLFLCMPIQGIALVLGALKTAEWDLATGTPTWKPLPEDKPVYEEDNKDHNGMPSPDEDHEDTKSIGVDTADLESEVRAAHDKWWKESTETHIFELNRRILEDKKRVLEARKRRLEAEAKLREVKAKLSKDDESALGKRARSDCA